MIEDHEVRLISRDSGFTQTMTRATSSVKNLDRGLEEAQKQATKTDRDMAKFGRNAGAAFGLITVAATRSAAEQRRLALALERTYGDAAGELHDFADEIQRTTSFSDDMAERAAATAGTLARNYGLTTDQIKTLIQVSADLAAVNGISLDDAMNRVTAAMRGEAESAEVLGLTMNDAAIGIDKMAASATDSEKAQFRLNALLEQSAFAQGAAAQMADESSAAYKRWGNEAQDALQGIGVALADYQGLIFAASASAAAIGPIGDAFTAIGAKAKLAQLGSAALGSTWIGPVGLVAGAAALAGGLYLLSQRHDDLGAAAERAAARETTLAGAISDVAEALAAQGLVQEAQALKDYFAAISEGAEVAEADLGTIAREMQEFQSQAAATGQMTAELVDGELSLKNAYGETTLFLSERTVEVLKYIGALDDGILTTEEMASAQLFLAGNFEANKDTLDDYAETMDQIIKLASDPKYFGQEMLDNAAAILRATEAGNISEEQGLALLKAIAAERDHYSRTLREAAEVTNTLTDYQRHLSAEMHAAVPVIAAVEKEILDNTTAMGEFVARGAEVEDMLESVAARHAGVTTGFGQIGEGADLATTQLFEMSQALIELDDLLATDLPGAAGNSFNMVVGFTDGIVQAINKTKDWTDAMTGVMGTDFMDDGTWSTLRRMVNEGTISQENYNEAIHAQEAIYRDSSRAQEAANEIQLKQIDVLQQGTKVSADYLEEIAAMPEHAQAVALGWADQNEQLKVQETAAMAAAAAAGELSAAQVDAFEKSVISAAKTDSTYARMLFDLGILKGEINDPSTWQIDASVSADGKSEIDTLAGAIYDMIDALAMAYDFKIGTQDDGALKRAGIRLEMAAIRMGGWDASVSLGSDTTAFWTGVNAIPYTVANRYIDVHYRGVGPTPYAHGGVVPGEAEHAALGRLSGAQLITANEHGQETFMMPMGTLINPAHATSSRGRGTSADLRDSRPLIAGDLVVISNSPGQLAVNLRQYRRNRGRP